MEFKNLYFKKVIENQKNKRRWCKNHPISYWGINQKTGEYYIKCRQGFKINEKCEIGTV